MQAVGLHSALAINRQRKRRREMKRAKNRRYSTQSVDLHGSRMSLHRASVTTLSDTRFLGTVTMFHIGIVFFIIGIFLVVSSLVPGYATNQMDELLGTGIFFIVLGIFLIALNLFLTKKDDDKLLRDVQHKLARTRSGNRLVRDPESVDSVSTNEGAGAPPIIITSAPHEPLASNGEAAVLDKIIEENETDTRTTTNGQHYQHSLPNSDHDDSPSNQTDTRDSMHSKYGSSV